MKCSLAENYLACNYQKEGSESWHQVESLSLLGYAQDQGLPLELPLPPPPLRCPGLPLVELLP